MSFRTGCLAAILGAVLAHPVAFLLMFLWGAVFGFGEIMASGPGNTTYGVDGGIRGAATLGFVYIISIGIVPLVISAVGGVLAAAFALGVSWLLQRRSAMKQDTEQPTPNKTT